MRFNLAFHLLFATILAGATIAQAGASATSATLQDPEATTLVSSSAWNSPPLATSFVDVHTGSPSPYSTAVYVGNTSTDLYVLFRCEQHGVPITDLQHEDGDAVYLDDYVWVGIDTSGNGSRIYKFEATPSGRRNQQSSENARYSPPWKSASQTSAQQWNVLLDIPVRYLSLSTKGPQVIRINLGRHVSNTGQDLVWQYNVDTDSRTDSTRWAHLTLSLRSNRPGHRLSLDPYVMMSTGKNYNVFGDPFGDFNAQRMRYAGLDLNYGLTPTISLQGTINPDFSNIETDESTIAPQEFQRYLTEFRPFFTQGASFIAPSQMQVALGGAPDTIFYSPSIWNFDRGLKIEGTAGRFSLGALTVSAFQQNDSAYGVGYRSADDTTGYWFNGVLAKHGNISDSTSEMGFILRNRPKEASFGVDASTENRQGHSSGGNFLLASTTLGDRRLQATAGYQAIGPNYSPIDGYTLVSDVRGPFLLLGFERDSSAAALKTWSGDAYIDRFTDGSGAVHQADAGADVAFLFRDLFTGRMGVDNSELRSYQTSFPAYIGGQTDAYHTSYLSATFADGTAKSTTIQYSWGPFSSAYLQQLSVTANQRLYRRWDVSEELDRNTESGKSGTNDSEWLLRLSVLDQISADSSFTASYRVTNGTGDLLEPGANLSFGYTKGRPQGNQIIFLFGTPASTRTLDRFLFKYVFHTEQTLR